MLHSKRSQEGYLLLDNRNSPGIKESDLTPEARIRGFMPTHGMFEAPTLRCSHCGTMVIINPARTRERHYCAKCDHYVCDNANCVLVCTPFVKQLEQSVAEASKASQLII